MSETTQFGKPLKLMKICLLLSGINVYHIQWHQITEILILSLYYFNILILHSVIVGEIYWLVDGIQIGKDFVEMSLTAPCITISILSTLKTIPLYFKRHIVCQILDTLNLIHPKADIDFEDTGRIEKKIGENVANNETGDVEEVKKDFTDKILANESVKILKTVAALLSIICVAVLVMFLLAPLGSMYWRYFKTGEMKIKYPFYVKYWFDVYEVGFWPLVYFHQAWATVIVCINIMGTETLFYSMCTYIEMHFRILCHQLENIQSGSALKTQSELVSAVKKHQLLIHLVEQTEALFSQPVLCHIVSSSLLICLSAFNITVAKELSSVFAFVTFLGLTLSQVSLLCFFGDKLMRSSTEVSGAIYRCSWYEFDVNARKAVLIILMRAQKPCKLTAAKFADLNLRAFTTILSRSWSYFALLKTVYN